MTRAARLATSVAIAAFAVLAILLARQIPSRHVKGDPGPGAFPLATAAVILAGALATLIADARRPAQRGEPWRQALTVAAGTLAYTLLMSIAGFVVSTALFLMAASLYLDTDRRVHPLAHVLVGVASSAAMWFVFSRLLDVVLPAGWIGF